MTPEQLQILKQKQRQLWDEGFDKYIKLVRYKKLLCKNVSDDERVERQQSVDEFLNKISDIEITIQTLKETNES